MDPSQQNRNTQPTTTKKKRTGRAHDQGQQFEIKMAAVIGLRGMQKGDNFELATNVKDAGKFDDLVYTTNDRRYCLQLKHTDCRDVYKLTDKALKGMLEECFTTYKRMADKDQLEFIIYTNKEPASRSKLVALLIEADVNTIFKTSNEGNIFKFIPPERTEYGTCTRSRESPSQSNKRLCLRDPDEEMEDFLNKVIIFTRQKYQWELDELIANEISKHDANKFYQPEYSSISQLFKMPLETWWRRKETQNMTADLLKFWLQRAKSEYYYSLVTSSSESCKRKLLETGIKFSDSETSWLKEELSNTSAVHLRSDALPLCGTILLEYLAQSTFIFVNFECLQSHRDELLHAWLGGVWEWLIVSCDAKVGERHISETCLKISEIIKQAPSNKCVIILSECSVQHVGDFVTINHKFEFEQLSKESQEMVLDKKIDFQGCEVTMRSVLQRHGNVENVLRPELVTDLVTEGTSINIGGKLQQNTGDYVLRVLKRKIWLPLGILRNRGTYPDLFAVSGIEEEKLGDLVPSDEAVGYFYFDEDTGQRNASENCTFEKSRFIVLRGRNLKSSFLKLKENLCNKTLHWLKYKNEKLLWKMTCGDVGNLRDCVDAKETGIEKRILREFMTRKSCEMNEDSIWDLGERTVLVVAEPGMGKSSTTTQVARHTKQRCPTSWVVRINWNDHTGKLRKIDAKTFNLDTLVEFLCSAAFSDSKYTDINRSLLKQALQSSGKVAVLMDGFDEICPICAEKVDIILSELMKTKVGRLWVTSRPVMRETLERKLGVTAFTLKKRESQE
jgi:hypothetical protein